MSKTSDMALQREENLVACKDCGEGYEPESMNYGLCEDCFADFQSNDLEYQIEKAMYLHDDTVRPSKG